MNFILQFLQSLKTIKNEPNFSIEIFQFQHRIDRLPYLTSQPSISIYIHTFLNRENVTSIERNDDDRERESERKRESEKERERGSDRDHTRTKRERWAEFSRRDVCLGTDVEERWLSPGNGSGRQRRANRMW